MKAIIPRLVAVERWEATRRVDLGAPVLVAHPDEWPEEDRVAYNAAGATGNREAQRDVVERHVGARPGPGTTVIEFRTRADGPKWGYEVGRTPSMIALCASPNAVVASPSRSLRQPSSTVSHKQALRCKHPGSA
ncbi:MAG: hypothetical protein M3Q10_13905 [Chloroflexota bacterium]|nr:hypothetical protein [Chloroflexota bacterium]